MKADQLSLLATLMLAFAALAALVLSGQAGIREDVRALRIDMLAGQTELRGDLRTVESGLRKDLKAVETGLREDLQAVETGLHEDLQAVETGLREEMRAVAAELRAGQMQLREDLAELGTRLALVEHRTDRLDSRMAAMESRIGETCRLDCPES